MDRDIERIPMHALEACELQNVIDRWMFLSNGPELHVAWTEIIGGSAPIVLHIRASKVTEATERDRILRVLKEAKGMVGGTNGAAAQLGLKRTALLSSMRKYNIAGLYQ